MLTLCYLGLSPAFLSQAIASSAHLEGKITLNLGMNRVSGPAVAVDEQGNRHVAWIKEENRRIDLYHAFGHRDSMNLTTLAVVNDADKPVASTHESPGIAVGPQGEVFLTWSTPHPKGSGNPLATVLQLTRSLDQGNTWQPSTTFNQDTTLSSHSSANIWASLNGSLLISWIDEREGKGRPATFLASSIDGGNTIDANIKVGGQSCSGNRTAVTTARDGTVYVTWRQALAGEVKETVVARSETGGQSFSPPVIVGHDQWMFSACPHRPASIGTDEQGRVYVTWYTEGPDENPGIYLAFSDNQAQTFSPRKRLNQSKGTFPDKPQMVVDQQGRVFIVWEEMSPVRHEIYFRYSLDRGRTFSAPKRLNMHKGENPTVAINSHGEAIIGWTEHKFPNTELILQPIAFSSSP